MHNLFFYLVTVRAVAFRAACRIDEPKLDLVVKQRFQIRKWVIWRCKIAMELVVLLCTVERENVTVVHVDGVEDVVFPAFSWEERHVVHVCSCYQREEGAARNTSRDSNTRPVFGACQEYESSECETARQHTVAEVACYRLKRILMGCTGLLRRGGRCTPSVFSS